jgi:hypothetical protein
MAGINFMSFIDGQRLAEQDNIRDEDRWRKQAAEDRAMQYAERDQGYKEKEQGYRIDEYAAKSEERVSLSEKTDVARLTSQAYDTIVAAAKAQGKEPWQVMQESPDFVLEGASPHKQALFNASMRELVKLNIAPTLRMQGKHDEAGQLEQRMGLAVNQSSRYQNTQRLMTDPEFASSELTKNGFTKNEDGTWTKMGVKVPAAIAIGVVANPESGLQTLINQGRLNDVEAQRLGVANQVATSSAQSIDARDTAAVTNHITSGLPKEALPSHLQYKYDQLATALKKTTMGSGSPPIPSSAADVNSYTAAPAAAAAPVAPAAIKNVASPISDWRKADSVAAPVMPSSSSSSNSTSQFEQELKQVDAAESRKSSLDAQIAAVKKDISLMTGLQGRKHFDQATVDSARNQLLALTQKSQEEEGLLSRLYSSVQRAPIRRPEYVNTLTTRYK